MKTLCNICTDQMLGSSGGGGSAIIQYTPAVVTSSSVTIGSGAVVLMEPSALITSSAASHGDEETDHQHHQIDQEASVHNADHSPIHLPSPAFFNNHISKSVSILPLFPSILSC